MNIGASKTQAILCAGVAVLALTASSGACAQATDGTSARGSQNELESNLGDIVVTARKRSENLQNVPVAITAFGGEQLNKLGLTSAADVADFVPNFSWKTEFGKASPQPYLRGVGTNNYAPNNSRPVAVYQDDVFIGANPAQGFSAFDLNRVEVLKGPQGTLYGRNATAGLINFVSRKPELGKAVNGFVRAEIGRFNTTNFEGAVGVPLGDATAARLALSYNRDDGNIKNSNPASTKGAGRNDDFSGRLQLLHDFGGAKLLVNGHFSRSNPDTHPFKILGLNCPAGVIRPTLGVCGTAFGITPEVIDSANRYETFKQDDSEKVSTWGAFARLDADLGAVQFTSLSAYDYTHLRRLVDLDGQPRAIELDHYNDRFYIFSQELRLAGKFGRSNWQAGVNYYNEKYAGFLNFGTPEINGGSVGNTKRINTEAFAAFGQTDLRFGDKWELSLGLRYTHEKKDVPFYQAYSGTALATRTTFYENFADQPIDAITFTSSNGSRADNLSGRASLSYKLDDNVLVYASLARGFRGGDVNGVALSDPSEIVPARPETLDAAEIGFKGDLFDKTLRLNLAAFYYDYKDQQVLSVSAGSIVVGVTSLNNVGRSKIKGFEAELLWAPSRNFSLNGNIGLLDATYDSFRLDPADPATDLGGKRIPFTNKVQGTMTATYDFRLASDARFEFLGSVNYFSKQYFDVFNREELSQNAYAVANASITYFAPDDRWYLRVRADNLFDRQYWGSGYNLDFYGAQALKAGRQRYIAAEAQVKF